MAVEDGVESDGEFADTRKGADMVRLGFEDLQVALVGAGQRSIDGLRGGHGHFASDFPESADGVHEGGHRGACGGVKSGKDRGLRPRGDHDGLFGEGVAEAITLARSETGAVFTDALPYFLGDKGRDGVHETEDAFEHR